MKRLASLLVATMLCTVAIPTVHAQTARPTTIKSRLDNLSGTKFVVVISYLPDEITSITCESWTMLGQHSYKNHNNFTIPAGVSIGVLDAEGFNGYCMSANSIIAHTDSGDYVGTLDRGPGNWNASTKLTFLVK